MQAYAEVIAPTAVTHAISLPLVSAQAQNLVIAKTSLLQVFEVRSGSANHQRLQNGVNGDSNTEARRLSLVAEFHLAGEITSLAGVRLQQTRSGGHGLLVAVRDAKFSLVEWDPETHGLSTVSIHYYEGEDLKSSPWSPAPSQLASYLTVDPSYRCAALKFGQRHLAILPFNQAGEDLDLDDYDELLDGPRDDPKRKASADQGSGQHSTPYGASFVLQLTALDPAILLPVHLAFLYEYREPTLGVLYASPSPSHSVDAERKDVIIFAAFTLDIAQRARTPLQAITGLPSDLFKLMPLALPIGGTLLLGDNEIVHVDQSGKVYGVAVNSFAKEQSSLPMSDQSELRLRLEGAFVHRIPSQPTTLLMALDSGNLVFLDFKMDGRTVSAISVRRVPAERGGLCLGSELSCAAAIGENLLFVGSRQADAVLLQCKSSGPSLSRKRSHADMLGQQDSNSEEGDEDEDDLYGDEAPLKKTISRSADTVAGDVTFLLADKLQNLLSLGEPVLAPRKRRKVEREPEDPPREANGLQLVMATGCGRSGGLSLLSQSVPLETRVLEGVPTSTAVWSLCTSDSELDNILIRTNADDEDGKSSVHKITASSNVEPLEDSDFETDTVTLFAGCLASGKRIVQITPTEVRTYDTEVKMSQILAMEDDDTEEDLRVCHASFLDPYLLVIRSDHSVALFEADSDGELEAIELSGSLSEKGWTSGSMHSWSISGSKASVFMLGENGGLYVFSMGDLSSPIYLAEDLAQLPQILSQEQAFRRAQNPDAIAEILVADVGDSHLVTPSLVVRNQSGDIECYEPFHITGETLDYMRPQALRWRKACSSSTAIMDETNSSVSTTSSLQSLRKFGSYSAVYVSGSRTSLIVKDPSSALQIIPLEDQDLRNVSSLNTQDRPNSLVTVSGKGVTRSAQLTKHVGFGINGWSHLRVQLNEEIDAVAYHPSSSLYVLSSTKPRPMPEELYKHWTHDSETPTLQPEVLHSSIKLIHPDTWEITDEYDLLDDCEHVTAFKSMSLEIATAPKRGHTFIVVGTAVGRGEDLPTLGGLYLFDVVQVAPDTNHPHPHTTGWKLKLVAQEEFRGAVTDISEASVQGLVVAAQGQKLLVRGLREDLPGKLFPVAFMDLATYITALKNLKGTGLSLIADALKGVQLLGFEARPYRLTPLSHSRTKLNVLACDFLPHEKQLLIVVSDDDSNIHILEFNPDNPKSVRGERLIHKSAMHTAHTPMASLLLPCPEQPQSSDDADQNGDKMDTDEVKTPQHVLLMPTISGAVIQITPLNEETYRRLSALQSHLSSVLSQPAAFNPRAYRNVDLEGLGYWGAAVDPSGRGMIDSGIVGRWKELGLRGRREAWARAGAVDEVELGKAEVEGCRGGLFAGIL